MVEGEGQQMKNVVKILTYIRDPSSETIETIVFALY
jgi:hypothetical protein